MRFTAALLIVVATSGCSLLREPEPAAPDAPPAERLLAPLRERETTIRSVRTISRADVRSPEGSTRTRQVILAEVPDRLRIDVLGPFGVSVRIVVAEGRLEAYDVNEGVLYFGAASPRNLARLARLPVEPRDAVRFLAGLPPQTPPSTRAEVLPADGGRWLLRAPLDGGQEEELVFDRDGLLRGAELLRNGDSLYEVRFGRYVTREGTAMPMESSVTAPPQDLSVKLRHTRVEINPDPAPEEFRLDVPKSARRVGLDQN